MSSELNIGIQSGGDGGALMLASMKRSKATSSIFSTL